MEKLTKPHILVVDDEEVVSTLCSRILIPLGYDVTTAVNGLEALSRFKDTVFDLLITDYRMPGDMDGLALGHAVKLMSPKTRIILMTAFPEVNNAVEMLRLGATDYLIKPFDKEELIFRVKICFEKSFSA